MLKGRVRSVKQARRLRREMTWPELRLWDVLRERPGGLKFRRQHPAGDYVLDFYCSEVRLAIEVDGEAHARGDRPERDAGRDLWLAQRGVETLRIPAAELMKDLDAVVRGILAHAVRRRPLHHPAAPGGPPPRAELGEDI